MLFLFLVIHHHFNLVDELVAIKSDKRFFILYISIFLYFYFLYVDMISTISRCVMNFPRF